eukprot:2521348-Prymnesium_polylepis.2
MRFAQVVKGAEVPFEADGVLNHYFRRRIEETMGNTTNAPPSALPAPLFSAAQCPDPSSMCCVVLFKGVEGEHCDDVPVWDMASWNHPGGPFVQSAQLCDTVRHSWRSKSGSHAAADP